MSATDDYIQHAKQLVVQQAEQSLSRKLSSFERSLLTFGFGYGLSAANQFHRITKEQARVATEVK